MKKTIKYTLLTFLFLIIIVSLFYIFISQYKTDKVEKDDSVIYVSTSTPAETYDFSTMTVRERAMLGLSTTLKFQVIRRSATGTPIDYRIIK